MSFEQCPISIIAYNALACFGSFSAKASSDVRPLRGSRPRWRSGGSLLEPDPGPLERPGARVRRRAAVFRHTQLLIVPPFEFLAGRGHNLDALTAGS